MQNEIPIIKTRTKKIHFPKKLIIKLYLKDSSVWVRYSFSILISFFAIFLQHGFFPLHVHTLLYPAVFLTAWSAGFRPALVAIAICVGYGGFLILNPLESSNDTFNFLIRISLFGFVNIVVTRLICLNDAYQAEIRYQKDLLEKVIVASKLGFYDWDVDKDFLMISPQMLADWGIEGESPRILEEALNYIHPEDVLRVREEIDRTVKLDQPYHIEYRVRRPCDQQIVWIEARGNIQSNSHSSTSRTRRFVGTSLNITERKLIEFELQTKKDEFEAVANHIPQLTWMADSKGHIFWFNKNWYDYTGLTFQLIQEQGLENLHAPDTFPLIYKKWKNALLSGDPWEDTFVLKSKTGEYRWFLSRARPIKNSKGEIIRWFGSNTDIHEQREIQHNLKKAQEDLQYQGQLLQSITDNVASCLFMMDQDGRPTFMNPAAERLTGYKLEEIKDKPLHKTIFSQTHNSVYNPLHNQEDIFVDKYGNLYPVQYSIAHLEKRGKVIGAVLEFRNITEQKNTENTLLEAVRARDEFLSIASHELKTPLTSLKLQSQILQKVIAKGGSEARSEERINLFCQQTDKQASRLNRLIDDILDVSRIRTGKLTIEKETFDLCELVNDVVERMSIQFSAFGAIPQVETCENLIGEWDKVRIEQVITNLLSNALHYGEKRPVKIALEISPSGALLSISDQGIGIAKENQEKIFERFERADVSANEISGLGLGLFITKQIVNAHGGRIWVESELGKGSTFMVELSRWA